MSKIQNIQVGDVVRLTCGGPWMTVALISSPQTVEVLWFENAGTLRKAVVTISALTKKGGR